MTTFLFALTFALMMMGGDCECRLNSPVIIPIGLDRGNYMTAPVAGILFGFFDDGLCLVFVPLPPGYGVFVKAEPAGEFQSNTPPYAEANGSIWFATASTSTDVLVGVCARCVLNLEASSDVATNTSVNNWSALPVCNSGSGQIWRTSCCVHVATSVGAC
jgi:hypothetical protein